MYKDEFRRSFLLFVLVSLFLVSPLSIAMPLSNGGVVSGEISVVGEIDQYTFTATAGHTIYLRVADTETTQNVNSSFFPQVELVDPNGVVVTTSSGALVGDISRSLVLTGLYTVRVRDVSSGNDETGSYNLYYARAPGANDDGILPNGGKVSGEIELGDIDSYRFNASAGETVYLRVADTETTEFINSAFFPSVRVLSPSGAFITSGSGSLVGDVAIALVESGAYTVIITDESSGEDATGSYDLFYAKAPGANDDGVLPNGGKVSGEIELGDIDSYRFNASAGETVYLRVADTETTEFINSGFFPSVRVLSPSGAFITSGSGALVGDVAIALVESGAYTVIITDESSGEDATGSYDLFYAKAPGANDDGCIADGQQQLGFIELGDIDSLSFQANAGVSLSVSVTDLDGSAFFPSIILLDPFGGFVTSGSGSNVAQINRTLTVSGVYTLIVLDESSGEDATGNYRIDISGTSISCPPPPLTPTAEVELVYSCLAGSGRFDVNVLNNSTAVSTYTFNLQGQNPRTRTVAFEGWGRMPITGRPPGSYTAEVLRDGVSILSDTIQINCGAQVPPVSSPEVTIVNACVGGNGFVLFQMVNPTNTARPYVIEFENVPNRSTTAAAYGQAVRGTSGRPDGVYTYEVRSGSTTIRDGAIEVDCD